MAINAKALVPTVALAAGTATPYACIVQAAILDKITVFNQSASVALTVKILLHGLVAPVGDDSTLVEHEIAARRSYMFPEITGHILNKDQFFTIITDTGDAVLRVSGREVS